MKKLIICLILVSASAFAYAQTAVIRELTGTVELQRAGSQNWTPARVGDRLDANTIISTGFKSTAVLAIGNSSLTVRPITRLSLKELSAQNNTETANISLNTGRIRVEVNPPAGGRSNVTVQTPTATASVRGTSFEMDPTSIKVLSGAVSFASADSNRAVTVGAGQATVVNTEIGIALTPMDAADAERKLPDLGLSSVGVRSSSISDSSRGQLLINVSLIEE